VSPGLPRALLFDWDNTLVDTWPAIHHALKATFEAMGRTPWTLEETRERVRASARDSFPALFGAQAEEAAAIFYRSFETDHLEKLRERPGAGDMLGRLAGAGYYLAVVSNKRGDLLRQEADALGWTAWFQRLIGANDAPRDKPALEPVLMALDGSGTEPGDGVWFVGDTDIDLVCAVQSGCVPVLLRAQPPADGEFTGHEPSHYLDSCEALGDLLAGGQAPRR
jgi:phosphoglycolate phosphatase